MDRITAEFSSDVPKRSGFAGGRVSAFHGFAGNRSARELCVVERGAAWVVAWICTWWS